LAEGKMLGVWESERYGKCLERTGTVAGIGWVKRLEVCVRAWRVVE